MIWSWGSSSGPFGLILSGTIFVLHIVVLCMALVRPHRSPAARVAWVAVIVFLPLVGIVAYLFLGETSIGHDRVRRLRKAEDSLLRPGPGARPPLDPTARTAFALVESINGFPPTAGNAVTLAPSAEAAIEELAADIEAAVDTVHISFYIWLDDDSGGRIAEAVASAARRGVTCRIMIDALGSRAFSRSPRWSQLKDAGAHLVITLDDVPRLGHLAVGRPDLRNHRKMVIIDDAIAYCGSRNCADPQFRIKAKYAPWVDVLLRCQGPIVDQQQWLFLTGWTAETGEHVPRGTAPSTQPPRGDAVGAMFGTGPTSRPAAMSEAFVTTIAAAREQLVITTPYFAPDDPLLQAICTAPQRGVRTTLILPARNDSGLVAATARSLYGELLKAGVTLYEYPLGLLHSKTITVDGHLSLVGSANMDRRSLELNYENNLLIESPQLTAILHARQQQYLAASQQVQINEVASWSLLRRLGQNTIAMLSPIL